MHERNTADKILVRLIISGKNDAFNEIITRYQKQIYSLAYRLTNNADDAQDLTQEAFIKIYLVLGKYDESRPFSPWMYRIASNVIYSNIRNRKYRLQEISLDNVIDFLPLKASVETHPEEYSIINENQYLVHQAISELIERYRVPIVMKYFEDLSYKDISLLLNLPVKTVETRLYRGKLLLQDRLIKNMDGDICNEMSLG